MFSLQIPAESASGTPSGGSAGSGSGSGKPVTGFTKSDILAAGVNRMGTAGLVAISCPVQVLWATSGSAPTDFICRLAVIHAGAVLWSDEEEAKFGFVPTGFTGGAAQFLFTANLPSPPEVDLASPLTLALQAQANLAYNSGTFYVCSDASFGTSSLRGDPGFVLLD